MINAPQNRQWKVGQGSDIFGTIVDTTNITFDTPGYARVSNRMVAISGGSPVTSIILGTNINYFFSQGSTYSNTNIFDNIGVNGTSNIPSGTYAAAYFNNRLYALDGYTGSSAAYNLRYSTGVGTWADLSLSLGTNAGTDPADMVLFVNLNKLAIGANNKVYLITTSDTVDGTNQLTLPDNLYVTSLAYNNNNLYIGTYEKNYGQAYMFVWDGSGTSAQYGFPTPATSIYSIKIYRSSVILFVSTGQLLTFTGNGFTQLAALPVYYNNDVTYGAIGNASIVNAKSNSMLVDGDLIYINLWAKSVGGRQRFPDGMKSGIWCYDPSVGFYHRHSLGGATRVSSSSSGSDIMNEVRSNFTDDTLTLDSSTYSNILTGTPFHYYTTSTTLIGNMHHGEVYYAIKVGSNKIKVALTLEDASAGTFIDIYRPKNYVTTGTHYIVLYPLYNISELEAQASYALGLSTGINATDREYISSRLFASGSTQYDGAVTSFTPAVFMEVPEVDNISQLTFAKFLTQNIEDDFISVTVKYSQLKEGETITVKAKLEDSVYPIRSRRGDDYGNPYANELPNGTWGGSSASNRSFITYDKSVIDGIEVGDEIFITGGAGAGQAANISSINYVASDIITNTDSTPESVTCTVDRDIYKVTGALQFTFSVDNFRIIGTITEHEAQSKTFRIAKTSKFAQIKLELRGSKIAVEDITINNVTHKPITR